MNAFPCILAIAFLAGVGVALAASERTITQKGKVFSETNVSIKNFSFILQPFCCLSYLDETRRTLARIQFPLTGIPHQLFGIQQSRE